MQTKTEHQFILGHLVDIDKENNLRSRKQHALLWDRSGKIIFVGSPKEREELYPEAQCIQGSPQSFILPGAIDCHIHYPQTKIIGAYGKDLLAWLNTHVWPEEKKLSSPDYAAQVTQSFFQNLLRAGTTTAVAYGSQFLPATELLLQAAEEIGLGFFVGLTLQDRNTHPELEQNLDEVRANSFALLERWHQRERIRYVVTPRFSPACTTELLGLCGELFAAKPEVYLQTHINESPSEIEWVRDLFPTHKHYLDTYDAFGLLGPRSLFAHSIHTSDEELKRMGEAGCRVVHCPSSNSFLGSGAFPLRKHLQKDIQVAVGTDVGAGTSFSMWREVGHAQLVQMRLHPEQRELFDGARMLKTITVDGARLLGIEDEVGNFEAGKWADFVIMSPPPNSYIRDIHPPTQDLTQSLFQMMISGHENMVQRTFIQGEKVYDRDASNPFFRRAKA